MGEKPNDGAIQKDVTPEVGGVATPVDGTQTEGTPEVGEQTTPKWMNQLPDSLKGHEALLEFESLGDALTALLAGPEKETKEKPEAQAELTYELPKLLEEDADPEGILHKQMQEAVKEMQLPQEQAEKIFKTFAEYYNGSMEKFREKGAEMCEAQLKTTWGDKYEEKKKFMERAYQRLVPEGSELQKGLKSTMAENNPYVAELLAVIGESTSEHTPPLSKSAGEQKEQGGFLQREKQNYPWG